MKVVIAGGGIAANVLLRQLRQRNNNNNNTIHWLRAYEQRSLADASPPGLNVLLNHNGMACLQEMDYELYEMLCRIGGEVKNWSARDMTGNVLYHLENVVQSGDASTPALVARWDLVHTATRTGNDDWIEYGTKVVAVERQETEANGEETTADGNASTTRKLKVLVVRQQQETVPEESNEWITDVDLVIAADGRYSTIRQQLLLRPNLQQPQAEYYGPPFVADFRIVVRDPTLMLQLLLLTDACPIWRVYNKPDEERIVQLYGSDNASLIAAARGYVRVGIMKLDEETIGLFGNIAKADEGPIDPIIQSGQVLYQLFLPKGFNDNNIDDHDDDDDDDSSKQLLDDTGRLVLQILLKYGDTAHWARKQETDTVYSALDDQVLFIGDAAGAMYPSLGQGANVSLEDACVTAAAFPNVKCIVNLRTPRRNFIKHMSRIHAQHIVANSNYFDTEIQNWNDDNGTWRADMRQLWNGKSLCLRAVTVTKENFVNFGQWIPESLDGQLFNTVTTDAELDLSQGQPRLYLMKLTGGRPLLADRITRHCRVTQCLGALGLQEEFYLLVHAPDDHPTLSGLQAFCIPPRSFVKLHVGTWHVGPMWTGKDTERTFINLELADTNEVDHDTILLAHLPPVARGDHVHQRIILDEANSNMLDDDTGTYHWTIPILGVRND